jgi:tyrosyl-tRNA synthetase
MEGDNPKIKNLFRGIVDVFPQVNLQEFFSEPKRIKLGFDPTSDFLHLGHSILLRKLQSFQNCGHIPVIIIGDFTAQIGDPTGKQKTRKQLTQEEVQSNIDDFISAIKKFIDIEKCEIIFNSNHLDKLKMVDIIKLQSTITVQQLLAKKDFSIRMENQTPISLHEFMYPLLQGFDSFHIQSDVELGGVDQKFNVSIGRDIQKHFNSKVEQIGMLMPILPGTDGVQKMSKSLNNAIGLDEHPISMFSKLEKIPDNIVDEFILLLTDCDANQFSSNPRLKQKEMAFEVVSSFHGRELAMKAQKDAESIVLSNSVSVDAPEISIDSVELPIRLANLLNELNLTTSVSDAKRKIKSGAIKLNGVKILDENFLIESVEIIENQIVQLSKKEFYKLTKDT